VTWPLPPSIVSLPAPPSIVTSLVPPLIVSSPPPPRRRATLLLWTVELVPFIVSLPSPPSSRSCWVLELVRVSLPPSPKSWAQTPLSSHLDARGPTTVSLPSPPWIATAIEVSLTPLRSMLSSPAPPLPTIEVTPENSWALPSDRLNWSDHTLIRPVPPLLATWMVSPMSSRFPCRRCLELGPMESVSAPPFIVPRKAGRLKGTENENSFRRANSKVSVNEVMKRLIVT